MKSCNILLWFLCVIFGYNGVCSLNMLGIFPYQGKSHFFVFEPYLKELVRRGHNLTVISYFPQKYPIENYRDISLAGKTKILEGFFPMHRSYWTIIQIINFLTWTGRDNCEILLSDKNVQNLWKSEAKFDLVVTELFTTDCALGLAYKMGAPVVGLNSHVPMPWHYDRFGIQYHPSFMPLLLLDGGTKSTLYQRLERFILHNYAIILYKYTCQNVNQNQLRQYFDVPPLEELARNMKFMLVYSSFVMTGPKLYPPNVIEVGGYHVAKPKELPSDLKKFIDESKHGIIYISFGSMLQAATTPKDRVEAIIAALSELPQRVIWKWDEKYLPGDPKNIYLSKWLPQNDILAHPKVVAFFSHCGMLSTTEAINYGVPMIGMPVFGDQPGNAGAIEESGLGVQIHVKDLTKENLLQKFNTVLDPQFRQKVKELSRIWHDRPLSPMDTAIYWTEFAARTKNYTFVSPAATVPLYQYLYLDIILVAASFLFVIYQTTKALISLLRNKMQRSPSKLKTNK